MLTNLIARAPRRYEVTTPLSVISRVLRAWCHTVREWCDVGDYCYAQSGESLKNRLRRKARELSAGERGELAALILMDLDEEGER